MSLSKAIKIQHAQLQQHKHSFKFQWHKLSRKQKILGAGTAALLGLVCASSAVKALRVLGLSVALGKLRRMYSIALLAKRSGKLFNQGNESKSSSAHAMATESH